MRVRRPTISRPVLTALLAAVVSATPVDPGGAEGPATGEAFYLIVYSAQKPGYHPETSHCFATFARITPSEGAPGARVELRHINWFSTRGHQTGSTYGVMEGDGRPTRPEPGENRTTREALLLAHRRGLRVTRWGPYEIDRDLYGRALRQIDLLEGHIAGRRVLYKSLDLGHRDGKEALALNCIHAISDIVREPTPLRTWTSYGDEAARKVVAHLGRWVKEPGREHPEAWRAIWRATWGDAPAPRLNLVRGAGPRTGTGTAVVQAVPKAGDPTSVRDMDKDGGE